MTITKRLSRFKTYPYTNTRVRVMRANLITDSEYRKLSKMELSAIAEFLTNRGYSQEIEELGTRYSGEELIERALKQNLANTYIKLIDISPEDVQELLQAYYRKFELQNLKIILRKHMRDADEDVTDVLIPTPGMYRETLQRYMEMDDIETIIDEFTREGFNDNLQNLLADTDNLTEMEDLLDLYYYRNLQEEARNVGGHSKLFMEFLQLEAALININLILRMKRRNYDYGTIIDRLVDIPTSQQIVDNDELAAQESYEDALELVRESAVGAYMDAEDLSPAEISHALDKFKLQKGIQMLHRDQLSVNPILGFMICKEIEFNNLRMLVRAKEEELGNEFIERNLINGVAK